MESMVWWNARRKNLNKETSWRPWLVERRGKEIQIRKYNADHCMVEGKEGKF